MLFGSFGIISLSRTVVPGRDCEKAKNQDDEGGISLAIISALVTHITAESAWQHKSAATISTIGGEGVPIVVEDQNAQGKPHKDRNTSHNRESRTRS